MQAVKDLTLQVEAGSIHAFMGPNGAGKTTTIKMCTGLLLPDQGHVRIAGHDVVDDGIEARRLLAYVPDEPYLYERLTAREFLQFTGRLYAMDQATYHRRCDEAIERFHLEAHFSTNWPKATVMVCASGWCSRLRITSATAADCRRAAGRFRSQAY